MAQIIELNDGLEEFELHFAGRKETAKISFNPTDNDLPKRLMETQKVIDEKTKLIKPLEIKENGLPDSDEAIEYLNEVNNVVYEAVDYAFGNSISKEVFKYCSPFTPVNGEYFILQFLNRVTPIIEKKMKDSQKKANAGMNKHLAKYMKK